MPEKNNRPNGNGMDNIIKHGYQPVGDDGVIVGGYIPSTDSSNNTPPNPPSGGSSQQDD